MKAARLHEALQQCLEALESGGELEAVLAAFPDSAADLRPALEAEQLLRRWPRRDVPISATRRSRARLSSALEGAGAFGAHGRAGWRPRLAPSLAASALALAAGLGSLVVASAKSLPGDALYSLKRVSETVSLRLTVPSRARLALEDEYSTRRADEVRRLLDLGRVQRLTFEGIVQGQSESFWLVTDIRVVVPQGIPVSFGIAPGMTVEVRGETSPQGHFVAEAIRLVGFPYVGPLRSMDGTLWTAGAYSFAILPDTWVDAGLEIGEVVLVSLRVSDSGSLAARAVLRMEGDVLPTSTAAASGPLLSEEPDEVESSPIPAAVDRPTSTPVLGGGTPGAGQQGPGGDDGEDEDDDEVRFEGVVESQSATSWVVSGTLILIDGQTEIEDDPQVGDLVRVEAFLQPDGQLRALRIKPED